MKALLSPPHCIMFKVQLQRKLLLQIAPSSAVTRSPNNNSTQLMIAMREVDLALAAPSADALGIRLAL
jgi:hypothetical protein